MKSAKSATIYDVAKLAGVSAATVSRVYSRPDQVSSATSKRVLDAATSLDYRVGVDTRPKRSARSRLLGVIVSDISNPFFLDILRGAEHAASVDDYVVLAVDTGESVPRALDAIERLTPLVDALVLVSPRLSNGEIQKAGRMMPIVSVNRPVLQVPSVLADNYAGAIDAIAHLNDQGAKSLAYIGGPEASWADHTRWRGLLDATGSTGPGKKEKIPTRLTSLPVETMHKLARMKLSYLHSANPTVRGGRNAFAEWQTNPTDAVLCFNNLVAVGFMNQALTAGYRVPEDVKVAAFDETQIADLAIPRLTTVASPSRSIGRVAAANALAIAAGLKTTLTRPRVLPTRLIVRASSLRC